MKKINNFLSGLNQKQRLVIAIMFPIIVIMVAIPFANDSSLASIAFEDVDSEIDPFDLSVTWNVWLIAFLIIGFVEFKLFGDTKDK